MLYLTRKGFHVPLSCTLISAEIESKACFITVERNEVGLIIEKKEGKALHGKTLIKMTEGSVP